MRNSNFSYSFRFSAAERAPSFGAPPTWGNAVTVAHHRSVVKWTTGPTKNPQLERSVCFRTDQLFCDS